MEKLMSSEPISISPGDASKVRPYFSYQHIQAAQLFADMSSQIEDKFTAVGSFLQVEGVLNKSFAINAVISSVAFMEAHINEVFVDAADDKAWVLPGDNETEPKISRWPNHNPMVNELSVDTIKQLAGAWKLGIPRTAKYPIVEKYQIALLLAEKDQFDTGIAPYQHVAFLVKLRNYLVHAEPKWIITASPNEADLKLHNFERDLKNFFPENPTMNPERKFFPDKCLGSGCAKWAVVSSTLFVDDFLKRMGITRSYELYRQFPCDFEFSVSGKPSEKEEEYTI